MPENISKKGKEWRKKKMFAYVYQYATGARGATGDLWKGVMGTTEAGAGRPRPPPGGKGGASAPSSPPQLRLWWKPWLMVWYDMIDIRTHFTLRTPLPPPSHHLGIQMSHHILHILIFYSPNQLLKSLYPSQYCNFASYLVGCSGNKWKIENNQLN